MSNFEHLNGGGYVIEGPRDKTSVDDFERKAGLRQSIYRPNIK